MTNLPVCVNELSAAHSNNGSVRRVADFCAAREHSAVRVVPAPQRDHGALVILQRLGSLRSRRTRVSDAVVVAAAVVCPSKVPLSVTPT